MRIIIGFIYFNLLTGCAGLGVGSISSPEREYDLFSLTNKRNHAHYTSEPERYPMKKPDYTKEQVIDLWGNPDEIDELDFCEVLVYHDGYTWTGLVGLVAFLPVPLALPTGVAERRIYIKENKAVSFVIKKPFVSSFVGVICTTISGCIVDSGTVIGMKKEYVHEKPSVSCDRS